jgi:hypothetical protein
MNSPTTRSAPEVLSYLYLRRAIGYLGLSLPFVLYIGGRFLGVDLQESISAYYCTPMRDVFVGTMCAVGVFMLSYRGYGKADRIAGNLACIFAVGVALFPTQCSPGTTQKLLAAAHYVCAAGFFLTDAYFTYCLFTKSSAASGQLPDEKRVCNAVYRACGLVMFGTTVLLVVLRLCAPTLLPSLGWAHYVFVLETLIVIAFAIAWLTKGEALWDGLAKPLTRMLARYV